jgi:hypothetical protein
MTASSSSSPATRTDCAGDDAAERDDRDLGRAAADVDDHVAARLVHRQVGADRCGHRLLDDVHGLAAPAYSAASCTARCSTPVMPDGTQMIIRGLLHRLAWTFWMKKRSIFSQTSKSAITPSFSGRIVLIRPACDPSSASPRCRPRPDGRR